MTDKTAKSETDSVEKIPSAATQKQPEDYGTILIENREKKEFDDDEIQVQVVESIVEDGNGDGRGDGRGGGGVNKETGDEETQDDDKSAEEKMQWSKSLNISTDEWEDVHILYPDVEFTFVDSIKESETPEEDTRGDSRTETPAEDQTDTPRDGADTPPLGGVDIEKKAEIGMKAEGDSKDDSIQVAVANVLWIFISAQIAFLFVV